MKQYMSKTWMVEINGKYLVKATFDEEKSACGAEHEFIDNIRWGIKAALAYDMDMMKTDCFVGAVLHDEFKTYEEIVEMSNKAKAVHEAQIARVQEEINELKARMNELEYKLNGVKNRDAEEI